MKWCRGRCRSKQFKFPCSTHARRSLWRLPTTTKTRKQSCKVPFLKNADLSHVVFTLATPLSLPQTFSVVYFVLFFFGFFFCEIDSATIFTRQTIHLFLYSIYIFCLSLSALESSPTLKLIIKPSIRPVKGKKFVLKLAPRLATVPNFMGVILTTPICWFPR